MQLEPVHLGAELDALSNRVTGLLHMTDAQLRTEYEIMVGEPPPLHLRYDRTYLINSLIQLQIVRIKTIFELET